ncbi:MAG: tetratricopeptide repeat protein [Cetobacterium sp.]|uniref:tetratricopeptide repeat protein n=1 Tax=unclassified Cetobacterium TaxID=2630983 RepID=UPI00163C4B3B|nr:tetratricopeptide repeat protein [Cetobacterium sp. 2A]MBC2856011.1 tetratricopeptide repeat protein [Cetobacterium sp. 2A]
MLKTQIFNKYCNKEMDLFTYEEHLRFELLENPNDKAKLEELATILYYKKDCKGAVKIYEKLLKMDSKNAQLWGFIGYLSYELEDYKKAIECFNNYLDLEPEEPFVYFLLGNVCSRAGLVREAINSYDFAIFLDLDIYTAHLDFAKKYEDMGRRRRALREYITAYEIDPRDSQIKEKIEYLKNEIEAENKQ